jgi:hypothetical protein
MLHRTGQPGRHPLVQRGHDLYETPALAVHALLDVETLPNEIWEPCTGLGSVARVLTSAGHAVIASDVHDYGYPLHFIADFFSQTAAPSGARCVLTNPPYMYADEFARHAIALVPEVLLLLRLSFLESVRRTDLLEHSGLRVVHLFRRRLPRMHRHGWTGPRASSSIAFAWFCWRYGYSGPIILNRISEHSRGREHMPIGSQSSRPAIWEQAP